LINFRLIKQAVIRLLLALAAVLAAVHCFRWLLLPALVDLFEPGASTTSLLRRTGILVVAALAYWAYVRLVEKRPATELRLHLPPVAVGALSGAALILIPMLLLFATGVYEVTAWPGPQPGLWGVAGLILVAATLEEIVFRCIGFRILEGAVGTLPALWLQSGVFAFLHIANADGQAGTQAILVTLVSGILIGGVWTMVFVISRSLWVTTANHAAWNLMIVLVGLPLSGLENWRGVALLQSEYRGPALLTGGLFGPEDSLVTIMLVAASLVAMIGWAGRRQRLVKV
jgi:membrane protease YdiL (CAAX protease family)